MWKVLLLGSVFIVSAAYAGGDAANMTDHELRVKADWNCKSAKGWCAEDQGVLYNKCKCAKRMCDAAQRAKEAAARGYDTGAECANGSSYCSTAKSAECEQALAGARPEGSGEGGGSSEPCTKEDGQACVKGPGGSCNCSGGTNAGGGESGTGNAKGISCAEVRQRRDVLKKRCEAAKASAEGDRKGVCKAYEDRQKEAERCDANEGKSSSSGSKEKQSSSGGSSKEKKESKSSSPKPVTCNANQWKNGSTCAACPSHATCDGTSFKCTGRYVKSGSGCVRGGH